MASNHDKGTFKPPLSEDPRVFVSQKNCITSPVISISEFLAENF